jgi:hypothetical protein
MTTLTASNLTALAAAPSPEEAYKIFAGAATQLIAQAVADALAKTLGAASIATASSTSIAGWEQFVKGASMAMVWGTPGVRSAPSMLNSFANASVIDPAAVRALGIGFSIGITGTF